MRFVSAFVWVCACIPRNEIIHLRIKWVKRNKWNERQIKREEERNSAASKTKSSSSSSSSRTTIDFADRIEKVQSKRAENRSFTIRMLGHAPQTHSPTHTHTHIRERLIRSLMHCMCTAYPPHSSARPNKRAQRGTKSRINDMRKSSGVPYACPFCVLALTLGLMHAAW